jgi:hypothetical protein
MTDNLPLSNIPLATVSDSGVVPDTRLKDVSGARSLWNLLREADLQSGLMRARAQSMFDNEPPYSQKELNESGRGFLANFNPGDAKAALDSSVSAFIDLDASERRVAQIPIRPGLGSEMDRLQWQQIIEEEFGDTLRSWPEYPFRNTFISHNLCLHGVGIAYFEDCDNWQFNSTGLNEFKIPRQTRTSEDSIEYAALRRPYQVNELYKFVKDKESAESEGWNCKAVYAAMRAAMPEVQDSWDYEKIEAELKNNDLVKGATASVVQCIHLWVREFDGTYSAYFFAENALDNKTTDGEEEFMCVKRHEFKSASQAFTFYTNGIGTNGTYHSISGLGKDMFNSFQATMRLMNRMYDIASASGPVLQASSEEAMTDLEMTPYGAFTLLSSGVSVQQTPSVSLQSSLMPALNMLQKSLQINTGQYTPDNVFSGNQERTAREVGAQLEHLAKLSITKITLYYTARDRHVREVARRFFREGYRRSDPGGHFVHDFLLRCHKRGVPAEVFDNLDLDRVRACRAIGNGSPAARNVALNTLLQFIGYYDQAGRTNLIRMLTAATTGSYEITDTFILPPNAAERPVLDQTVAEMENGLLSLGQPMEPKPNENMEVHLQIHTGKLGEFAAQFTEAGQNPEMYPQIVEPMSAIYQHAVQTLEMYTAGGVNAQTAAQFNEMLQQAGEIIVNGSRHIQKLERQQQEQGAAQGQTGAPDPAAEMQNELERKTIEFQVKLEQMQQMHEAKLNQMAQKAALQRQLDDAKTAALLQRKGMEARSTLAKL